MRHQARLSTAVPHSTAFLPPAFMAMLPPMQQASAEVGSTANTRPSRSAASLTRRVTTPASVNTTALATSVPGKRVHSTAPRPSSFSVLITAHQGVSGTAPPVYPVPPPRGIMVRPSSMQSRTRCGISASVSGVEHQERQLDPPVGRVGDVRDPGVGVEADVVGARVLEQRAPRPLAQCDHVREMSGEAIHGGARGRQQLRDLGRAALVGGVAALLHFAQPVVQGLDELGAALRIVDQVVLQEGIAIHHPDVAQHLVQHARRAAGAPLGAQLVEQLP